MLQRFNIYFTDESTYDWTVMHKKSLKWSEEQKFEHWQLCDDWEGKPSADEVHVMTESSRTTTKGNFRWDSQGQKEPGLKHMRLLEHAELLVIEK